jgi:hypothetical protein
MNIFDDMKAIKENFEAVIDKLHNHEEENMAINIIIDDSDPQSPIFVEVENDKGQSISIGEELRTDEGYRKIRINTYSIISNEKI